MSEAQAQQPSAPKPQAPTVLLVYRARDPFGLRLEGELRSIGVRVVARSRLSHSVPSGTIAVATVFGEPRPRIEIRVGSHPAADGEADVLVEVGDADEALKTTKAAESVRAAIQLFVEAETASPSQAPAVSEPPPLPPAQTNPETQPRQLETAPPPRIAARPSDSARPESAPNPRRWLAISAGLGAIVGSQGAGGEVISSALIGPTSWLTLEPFVSIPFVPANIEGAGGSADLYAGMVGGRVGFQIVDEAPFSLDIGGGFAGVWLRVVGSPLDGFVGKTVDGFVGAALVDVTPRLHLYGGLWLSPRLSLGVALPPPEIVFGGAAVGTWGAPFGALGLSTEITVFP